MSDSPTTTDKGLAKSTLLMAFGTMLSRITGFGRTLALILAFGVNDRFGDVYTVANTAPNIVYELILGGVLAGTLVPVFVRKFATSENEKDGWDAINAILTVTGVVLVVLSALVALAAPLLIDLYTINDNSAEAESARDVATFLLRIFAPQVALYGFISLATALLQAKRKFAVPMFAPILNNIVVIGVLLAMPHIAGEMTLASVQHDIKALTFLGIGTTAGVLAMTLCLIPSLHAITKGNLRWNWKPHHEAIHTVIKLSGWTAGFVIANQIALWIMTVLAYRNEGDYVVFMQAYSFFILPHAILTVSLISAMVPDLAEKWARNEVDAFRTRAIYGVRLVSAVLIPAAVGYALLAHSILDIIPSSDALTNEGKDRIANAVLWMAIGLPGFSGFFFITRALQSMQNAKTVFWLYVFENGVNIATAFPMHAMWGVEGLAASQSLAYTAAAVVGLVVLRRHTQGIDGAVLTQSLLRIGLATAAMAGPVLVVRNFANQTPALAVIGGILSGAVVYLAAARLLGIKELDSLIRSRRKAH